MARPSRTHHADEFGKSGASASVIGANAPTIGAASMIAVDGIAERESGVTPPPPPISVRAIVIGLVVMFLLGVGGVAAMLTFAPQLFAH